MRNVTLAVLGFVGLSLLLCGSGEVLAQTDATDSRVQGTEPGDVRVGTGGSEALGTGTQTAASGADASSAELRQTVLRLQSEVAMLREDALSRALGAGFRGCERTECGFGQQHRGFGHRYRGFKRWRWRLGAGGCRAFGSGRGRSRDPRHLGR